MLGASPPLGSSTGDRHTALKNNRLIKIVMQFHYKPLSFRISCFLGTPMPIFSIQNRALNM